MITGKIDVMKIRKDKLFTGAKGTYLDITLIPTPTSEYGDYMIVQDLGKEARLAGEKGPILGNAKIRKPTSAPDQPVAQARPAQQPTASAPARMEAGDDSNLPF